MECEFCRQLLSNKSSLKNHQKTAKYCLKKQGQISKLFECTYCTKYLSTKQHLKYHLKSCREKKEKELEEDKEINKVRILEDMYKARIKSLETQVTELQKTIERISLESQRPNVTNNFINDNRIQQLNNLIPITDERIEHHSQYLTIDHIKNGASGLSKFSIDHPYKDGIICVDFSRKKIMYKDGGGDIITDIGMNKLGQKLFSSIMNKTKELLDAYKEVEYKKVGLLESSTVEEKKTSFAIQMIVMKTVTDHYSTYKDMVSIANGGKEALLMDYGRDVCSQTVV